MGLETHIRFGASAASYDSAKMQAPDQVCASAATIQFEHLLDMAEKNLRF